MGFGNGHLSWLVLRNYRAPTLIVAGRTVYVRPREILMRVLALAISFAGLYGLIAYSVEQRTLEFGIRLALGADSPALRNMIVRQAMTLAAIGIGIGLAAAFGLTRLLTDLLYHVKPTDPLIFASVAVLLGAVALLASYLPARRALRIDPALALRHE